MAGSLHSPSAVHPCGGIRAERAVVVQYATLRTSRCAYTARGQSHLKFNVYESEYNELREEGAITARRVLLNCEPLGEEVAHIVVCTHMHDSKVARCHVFPDLEKTGINMLRPCASVLQSGQFRRVLRPGLAGGYPGGLLGRKEEPHSSQPP